MINKNQLFLQFFWISWFADFFVESEQPFVPVLSSRQRDDDDVRETPRTFGQINFQMQQAVARHREAVNQQQLLQNTFSGRLSEIVKCYLKAYWIYLQEEDARAVPGFSFQVQSQYLWRLRQPLCLWLRVSEVCWLPTNKCWVQPVLPGEMMMRWWLQHWCLNTTHCWLNIDAKYGQEEDKKPQAKY